MAVMLALVLAMTSPPALAIRQRAFQSYELSVAGHVVLQLEDVQYVEAVRSDATHTRDARRVLVEIADGGDACPLSYRLVTLGPQPRLGASISNCGSVRQVTWRSRDAIVTLSGPNGPRVFCLYGTDAREFPSQADIH